MTFQPLQDRILIRRIKPGDRVLFGKYSGTEIKIDGVEHLVVREDEILGVLG